MHTHFFFSHFQKTFAYKAWEKGITLDFDPTKQSVREQSWVDFKGGSVTCKRTFVSAETAFEEASAGEIHHVRELCFPNPQAFVAGQIHEGESEWDNIFDYNSTNDEINGWVKRGIDIRQYIKPFKGEFWGQNFDSDYPPQRFFNNSNKCKSFISFINDTIEERLQNGSIECVGKVGHVSPPHIVAPLTVEPSKPRLCINLMYLNNWIVDRPFSLDTLKDIPRVIEENACFTSIDDKSGFDNVRLASESHDLLGFQWAGYFFKCLTLPFGFKLSSYFYQLLNLQPTSYIRSRFLIPMFLYIDDRLIECLRKSSLQSDFDKATLANYIVCEILLRLGYCINILKSVFVPTKSPVFLGFIVDSVERCFRITEAKKEKFAALRDLCLNKSRLSVLDLQQLAGRCISFMLAVPGAKLYTREMNYAISLGIKSKSKVTLTRELRDELQAWNFPDTWDGKMEWKKEKHLVIEVHTDASTYKWGGVIHFATGAHEVYDYWSEVERKCPIMILEGKALLNVLRAVSDRIRGKRVDANVDNQALFYSFYNEGSKSRELNSVLKEIFNLVLQLDIVLNLAFVKSEHNLADEPSRVLKKSDAMLSERAWSQIQQAFGPHSLDLFSLDSNAMIGADGKPMQHFTPFWTPGTAGVNAFAQNISQKENCYAFPPFNLLVPLIGLINEGSINCTVVVPAYDITPVWMPLAADMMQDALVLGLKGQKGILRYPSKKGYVHDKCGLPWNLWALRLSGQTKTDITTFGKFLFLSGASKIGISGLLCVGDSMIRFLNTTLSWDPSWLG